MHLRCIMRKLGVVNRTQVAIASMNSELIPPIDNSIQPSTMSVDRSLSRTSLAA